MTRLTEQDKQFVQNYIDEQYRTREAHKPLENAQIAKLVADAVKDAVKEAVQPLHAEIASLRDILNETRDKINSLQDKIIEKNAQIKHLEETIIASTKRNLEMRSLIMERTDDNESYSRKDCLRISGVACSPDEDNSSLKTAVINKLSENGVKLEESDIFRLHRSGKRSPMNNYLKYINVVNDTPITIDPRDKTETAETIIRFTNWTARSKVYGLHYKKNLHIRVNVDLTKHRRDILSNARIYLKDGNLKGYCYANPECRLILKDVDSDRRHFFKSFTGFKYIAQNLTVDPTFHKPRQNRDLPGWLDSNKQSPQRIININTTPDWKNIPNCVFIGRPSVYQNPFKVAIHGRTGALNLFEQYVRNSPELLKNLLSLKHCPMACFCFPALCHANIIIKLIEKFSWVYILIWPPLHPPLFC